MAEARREVARNIQQKGTLYRFLVGPNGIARVGRIGRNLRSADKAGWKRAESELVRLQNRGNI